jgi:hypothetical protein
MLKDVLVTQKVCIHSAFKRQTAEDKQTIQITGMIGAD